MKFIDMSGSIKIIACYFQNVFFHFRNESFIEVQCGAENNNITLEMLGDNTGDNISDRNIYWSEITGLYWFWKNCEHSDYVGLCSYRRVFNFANLKSSPVEIISLNDKIKIDKLLNVDHKSILDILSNFDVITPIPYTYAHPINVICNKNYYSKDFKVLEDTIAKISPEYLESYKKMYYQSNEMIGHNMFIMSRNNFNKYCEWVFCILFEVEKLIDPSIYPKNKIRVFGYMHEILLGVFIDNQKLKIYRSQITWITEESKGFKFNSSLYRTLANMHYFLKYKLK